MHNKHAKSPCCGAAVSHYGGRRRRCESCYKTFRIRQKKRGRKRLRLPLGRVAEILLSLQSITRMVYSHLQLSTNAKQKRFQQQLRKFISKPYQPVIVGRQLVMIIDGLWHLFRGKDWVLYEMAIKSCDDDCAWFLDPILLPGKECLRNWQNVVQTISPEIRKRIVAVISDGFNGCNCLAKKQGWILQRCHFHLLLHLQSTRGKRKKYWNSNHFREQIYQTIRTLITVKEGPAVPRLTRKLKVLVENKDCPKRLKFIVHDTLRQLDAFRSYCRFPHLHLPNTTNVVESMNSLLRKLTNRLNNPQSLLMWAKAYVRAKKKLRCQGGRNQPN